MAVAWILSVNSSSIYIDYMMLFCLVFSRSIMRPRSYAADSPLDAPYNCLVCSIV